VNAENKGLIVTKMEAAARAKGSILMFMEPHVVAHPHWLEPLVNRVQEEPNALVMPIIDALNGDMSVYQQMQFGHWRFEWNMNLIFTNPWESDKRGEIGPNPYPSPATSGGIYAIRKEWWDHLELFDPELIRWGGDHIEASHKVWRCGGRVEMHPCSRIGHWYRVAEERPYEVPVPQVVRNYKRLAEVWMDNHKDSFHKVKPEARNMEFGDVAEMHKARDRLQCKDMDWYLKNVDLELAWEESRICIPGADKRHGGCPLPRAAAGRSTIDVTLSGREYEKRWKKSPMYWGKRAGEL
jgi:polypeptide N-acetylgalactosaminyltransferase